MIVRRGMITLHKCQVWAQAGLLLKPNICKLPELSVVILISRDARSEFYSAGDQSGAVPSASARLAGLLEQPAKVLAAWRLWPCRRFIDSARRRCRNESHQLSLM